MRYLMSTMSPSATGRQFRLHPSVTLSAGDGHVDLLHPALGGYRLRGLSAETLTGLRALADGAVGEPARLAGSGLARLLDRLPQLVAYIASGTAGRPLLTATPISRAARLADARPAGQLRLSRYAYLRRLPETDTTVVESPLSGYRLTVAEPAVAALLTAGFAADRPAPGLTAAEVTEIGALLAATRMLADEDTEHVQSRWEFHDLLFHTRSRYGQHDYPGGGVYPHAADRPSPPPVLAAEKGIDLAVPDWDQILAADPTLSEVLESRRSLREYDQAPVTVAQLGELLYRVARVRGVGPLDAGSPVSYQTVSRPFPAGGGLGEVELYVTVVRCAGLEPGIYRYDPAGHRLVPRPHDQAARMELVQQAYMATGRLLAEPQLVFTVTSRLERISWKYATIAYALALKHVGVLYQTMYLVATAMGLAPCAFGSGDSEVAARAIGLDWIEQPTVGEFAIGSRRAADQAPSADQYHDVVRDTRERR
jgi:SagB-type dehydrogenase family enzyme